MTRQEYRGILSKLSSRVVEKQPGTTNSWKTGRTEKIKKLEKSCWQFRKQMILYQSCVWERHKTTKTRRNTFKEIWKKLKKFLTSRKQHDKISKLSVRQQDKKWTLITEQWNTFLESSFKIIKRTIERSLKTVKGIN